MEVESETELEAILADSLDNSPIPPAGAMQSPPPMAVQQTPVGATDPSGLTPAGTTPVGGEDQSEVGLCEVCMYVMENKMQHQPYLCKGLKDPHYQNICVQVMESLMWWISNQVSTNIIAIHSYVIIIEFVTVDIISIDHRLLSTICSMWSWRSLAKPRAKHQSWWSNRVHSSYPAPDRAEITITASWLSSSLRRGMIERRSFPSTKGAILLCRRLIHFLMFCFYHRFCFVVCFLPLFRCIGWTMAVRWIKMAPSLGFVHVQPMRFVRGCNISIYANHTVRQIRTFQSRHNTVGRHIRQVFHYTALTHIPA